MKSLMKKSIFVLASLTVLMTAQMSWAGCGSIACRLDNDTECSFAQHRFDLFEADRDAVAVCEEHHHGPCRVIVNECHGVREFAGLVIEN
jgi:hypothetical protein